jgi:hypothetical protein
MLVSEPPLEIELKAMIIRTMVKEARRTVRQLPFILGDESRQRQKQRETTLAIQTPDGSNGMFSRRHLHSWRQDTEAMFTSEALSILLQSAVVTSPLSILAMPPTPGTGIHRSAHHSFAHSWIILDAIAQSAPIVSGVTHSVSIKEGDRNLLLIGENPAAARLATEKIWILIGISHRGIPQRTSFKPSRFGTWSLKVDLLPIVHI